MRVATLIAWILTVVAGGYLVVAQWLAGDRLTRQATKITRFPAVLPVAHLVLGSAGLVLWVRYLVSAQVPCAWAAFGVLVVTALLGFTMLTRWLVGGRGRHERDADRTLPAVAIAVHGTLAITTFVPTYLTASTAATG
jgi:hypothetical protein